MCIDYIGACNWRERGCESVRMRMRDNMYFRYIRVWLLLCCFSIPISFFFKFDLWFLTADHFFFLLCALFSAKIKSFAGLVVRSIGWSVWLVDRPGRLPHSFILFEFICISCVAANNSLSLSISCTVALFVFLSIGRLVEFAPTPVAHSNEFVLLFIFLFGCHHCAAFLPFLLFAISLNGRPSLIASNQIQQTLNNRVFSLVHNVNANNLKIDCVHRYSLAYSRID